MGAATVVLLGAGAGVGMAATSGDPAGTATSVSGTHHRHGKHGTNSTGRHGRQGATKGKNGPQR